MMERKRWIPLTALAAGSMLAGALLAPRGQVGAQVGPPQGPGWVQQGQPPMGPGGPMGPGIRPPMGPGPVPPAMTATNDHVYVLLGNTLMQFSAKDLKQLHKVTLEMPQPPRPDGPDVPNPARQK